MNSDPDAPMDNQLLQLERELFSLSPVETPRHLAARLDRQVEAPVGIGRRTAASAKVIPFQWRKIVVPAAAAVVVVSVLNHLDTPAAGSAGTAQFNSKPVVPGPGQGRSGAVETPAGYVLRSEPVLINPGTWQAMDHQYFLLPFPQTRGGYNAPQRSPGLTSVKFH